MKLPISKPVTLDKRLYFQPLIDALSAEDLIAALEQDAAQVVQCLQTIPAHKVHYSYAPEKWTLLQVVQHIVDCERVFGYRTMAIARGERHNLQGFDENEYASQSVYPGLTLESVLKEFQAVRESTIWQWKTMNPEVIDNVCLANNIPVSPRIIGWFAAAHSAHHLKMLKSKYL